MKDFQYYFNEYLEYCKLYRKNGTYKYYKKVFQFYSKVFKEINIKSFDDFTEKTHDDLVKYMKFKTNKKNSKINDYISALYTVLNHFKIETKIIKRKKLVDDTDSFKVISDNELNQLLKHLQSIDLSKSSNKSWILAVLLMLDTGVRINELIEIKTRNIDLESRYILLDETKSGKKRIVKFGDLSEKILRLNYDLNHEFLLWNYFNNSRMTKHSLYHFFDRLNKKLNFASGNIHPHRLRKTFATKLLKMGCPLTTIQKLLGHSDIRMTMIYLEVDEYMISKDYDSFYPY